MDEFDKVVDDLDKYWGGYKCLDVERAKKTRARGATPRSKSRGTRRPKPARKPNEPSPEEKAYEEVPHDDEVDLVVNLSDEGRQPKPKRSPYR